MKEIRFGDERYFGLAFGANPNHSKYLNQVPEYLRPFNQWLRKVNGHGHIKIWDIKK